MAETNVVSTWNAAGDLEFRQANMPWNISGPILFKVNASNNGVDLQTARTATATTNGLNYNANYYLRLTDNLGATYYLGVSDALW